MFLCSARDFHFFSQSSFRCQSFSAIPEAPVLVSENQAFRIRTILVVKSAATDKCRDMGSCLGKADTNSSEKLDAESDMSNEPVYNKQKTGDAGYHIDKEIGMNQLVSDLTPSCPGPMDQLPLDCIIHVMHFMPVQQVFVCMSVNKTWNAAAGYTVRRHERVQLVVKKCLWQKGEIQIPSPLDLIVANDSCENDPLSKSLLLMENLKQLEVYQCVYFDLKEATESVIVKNAASLQVLYTAFDLPSDSSPVIYQQLKKLDCIFMSPGTECPVLEELIIYPCCDVEALNHLPILTMRKFMCKMSSEPDDETGLCRFHGDRLPPTFSQKVVQAAKRLVHLTHLKMYFKESAPLCNDIETIMDDFHFLVVLDLNLFAHEFNFDPKVDRLVLQNPHLKELTLVCLRISDPALTSIARLPDLRRLELHGHNVHFTMDGVLTLLRSRLRHVLIFAKLEYLEMNGAEKKSISDEIDLIAGERGKPLKRRKKMRSLSLSSLKTFKITRLLNYMERLRCNLSTKGKEIAVIKRFFLYIPSYFCWKII